MALLNQDPMLGRALGYELPRVTALRNFLERFHDEELALQRPSARGAKEFYHAGQHGFAEFTGGANGGGEAGGPEVSTEDKGDEYDGFAPMVEGESGYLEPPSDVLRNHCENSGIVGIYPSDQDVDQARIDGVLSSVRVNLIQRKRR